MIGCSMQMVIFCVNRSPGESNLALLYLAFLVNKRTVGSHERIVSNVYRQCNNGAAEARAIDTIPVNLSIATNIGIIVKIDCPKDQFVVDSIIVFWQIRASIQVMEAENVSFFYIESCENNVKLFQRPLFECPACQFSQQLKLLKSE